MSLATETSGSTVTPGAGTTDQSLSSSLVPVDILKSIRSVKPNAATSLEEVPKRSYRLSSIEFSGPRRHLSRLKSKSNVEHLSHIPKLVFPPQSSSAPAESRFCPLHCRQSSSPTPHACDYDFLAEPMFPDSDFGKTSTAGLEPVDVSSIVDLKDQRQTSNDLLQFDIVKHETEKDGTTLALDHPPLAPHMQRLATPDIDDAPAGMFGDIH